MNTCNFLMLSFNIMVTHEMTGGLQMLFKLLWVTPEIVGLNLVVVHYRFTMQKFDKLVYTLLIPSYQLLFRIDA